MARTKRTERCAPGPHPQLQPDPSPPDAALGPSLPPISTTDASGVESTTDEHHEEPVHDGSNAINPSPPTKRSRKFKVATTTTSPPNRTSDKHKPFSCTYCDPPLYFGRKHDLKRHMDTKHLNDRPYQCPRPGCGHASNRRDHARRHLKIRAACADYVRGHYATDAGVVAALERAYGGRDGGGSDVWITELEIDGVLAGGSGLSATAAGATGSSGEGEDVNGRTRAGEDDLRDEGLAAIVQTMDWPASAAAATDLPDSQLFLTAAYAAESPYQATLHSPFVSVPSPPIDPATFAAMQQQPAAGGPSYFFPLPPNMTTSIPPYQSLTPLPFYRNPFNPPPQPAMPTQIFAPTPATYPLPHWPAATITYYPTSTPNPANPSSDGYRFPFGLAPAAGYRADPSHELIPPH